MVYLPSYFAQRAELPAWLGGFYHAQVKQYAGNFCVVVGMPAISAQANPVGIVRVCAFLLIGDGIAVVKQK